MRICYTSDLHGSRTQYERLGELVRKETPDLLILGGDLFRDVDLDQPVPPQIETLAGEFIQRVRAWRETRPRLVTAVVMGNHELACMVDALRPYHDAREIALLDLERPWEHDGVTFLGYACTPPSPHWAKDFERLDARGNPIPDFPGVAWDPNDRSLRPVDLQQHFGCRATIAEQLASAPVLVNPWVLVAHSPPHDCQLDRLHSVTYPIGSRAIRDFIERRQPLVGLHGHIHDSPEVTGAYAERFGDTLCVNPGQSHEYLYAVVFDAEQPEKTIRHSVFP